MTSLSFKTVSSVLIPITLLSSLAFQHSFAMKITLYDNMNKQGEGLELKDIQNCTSLPPEWQDRTSSLNIYRSICIKVFEHSDCKGRYVTLKSNVHGDSEYLDNLRGLGFNDVISSVSPCALQIEAGRYVIQNLGDNKMLTLVSQGIYSQVYSKYWKNIRAQNWDISQVAGSAVLYEFTPVGERSHSEKPVIYDKTDLPKLGSYKLTKPAFLIESVDDWKYVIRDSRTKFCLATSTGKKDEISPAVCNVQSKNQQWIFRQIE